MTRSVIIILIFLTAIVSKAFGQIATTDQEIFQNVIAGSKTCDKTYLANKTDTFFIEEFQKFIKENSNYFDKGKSSKIPLTKTDKAKLLKELDYYRNFVWTDSTQFSDIHIVSSDSIFKIDNYLDNTCSEKLETEKKNVKVLSLCKPIFIDNGNSFIIYTIEIGVLLKWKSFYYASSKLTLYKKTKDNKWTKVGDLYSSYACNG